MAVLVMTHLRMTTHMTTKGVGSTQTENCASHGDHPAHMIRNFQENTTSSDAVDHFPADAQCGATTADVKLKWDGKSAALKTLQV